MVCHSINLLKQSFGRDRLKVSTSTEEIREEERDLPKNNKHLDKRRRIPVTHTPPQVNRVNPETSDQSQDPEDTRCSFPTIFNYPKMRVTSLLTFVDSVSDRSSDKYSHLLFETLTRTLGKFCCLSVISLFLGRRFTQGNSEGNTSGLITRHYRIRPLSLVLKILFTFCCYKETLPETTYSAVTLYPSSLYYSFTKDPCQYTSLLFLPSKDSSEDRHRYS